MYSLGTANAGEWAGCNAGTRGFGILHNGDVIGCTSIRDRKFIEGNILKKSIVDIWNAPDAFKWSRGMKKSDLGGACKTCIYGETCLGGCPNTRLTMNGTMQSENPYCVYRTARLKLQEKLDGSHAHDTGYLFNTAERLAKTQSYQEAGIILEHLRKDTPDNADILSLLGFTHFFLGNYEEAKEVNETILARNPDDWYANKGLGLSLHKLGKTKEGIDFLKKSIKTAPAGLADPYHDLAAVYYEIGDSLSAAKVLSQIQQ